MEKKVYYAVMKLNKWEDIKLQSVGQYRVPFPISFQSPNNGEVGYIHVFDTRENAIKWNNGKDENIVMVQEV
jgi:hypothetical protein